VEKRQSYVDGRGDTPAAPHVIDRLFPRGQN
jgi:hypothetical protein